MPDNSQQSNPPGDTSGTFGTQDGAAEQPEGGPLDELKGHDPAAEAEKVDGDPEGRMMATPTAAENVGDTSGTVDQAPQSDSQPEPDNAPAPADKPSEPNVVKVEKPNQ